MFIYVYATVCATTSAQYNVYVISHKNRSNVQLQEKVIFSLFVCLFVLEFYGPVNKEVMSSRSVNSGTVPGQA